MIYKGRALRRRQRTNAALVIVVFAGAVLLFLLCGIIGQTLI